MLFFKRFPEKITKRFIGVFRSARAQDNEITGQQILPVKVERGRDELPPGKIARSSENNQHLVWGLMHDVCV